MTREAIVTVLGILLLITPFLGIPRDMQGIIVATLGTLVVFFGISLRHARYLRSTRSSTHIASPEHSRPATVRSPYASETAVSSHAQHNP